MACDHAVPLRNYRVFSLKKQGVSWDFRGISWFFGSEIGVLKRFEAPPGSGDSPRWRSAARAPRASDRSLGSATASRRGPT